MRRKRLEFLGSAETDRLMTLSHGSVNECRKVQVGCTLIEMQPEQFSRKGKSAERNGKTDYHIIADMASAILCNGSEECLIPPLRRELCNYLLHGAGSHGVLGVRAPADADCNGLSTKQRCYSRTFVPVRADPSSLGVCRAQPNDGVANSRERAACPKPTAAS